MKALLIYLSIVLIFGMVNSSYVVDITCQKCKQSCISSNCYRLTAADGLDKQLCLSTGSCDLTLKQSVTLNKCNQSFYGGSCQHGVCYYPQNKYTCATSFIGSGFCSSSTWIYLGCGDCTKTSNCVKCREVQTSIISYTFQQCIGPTCNGLGNMNLTLQSCTGNQDSYGNSCSCCVNVTGDTSGNLGVCMESSDMFSNSQVILKAQTSLGATYQYYMRSIVLLVLIFAALLAS